MRILHIIPRLSLGGAERVTIELARHAADAGHDVTIVVGAGPPADPSLLARLPRTVRVEYLVPFAAGRLALYSRGIAWVLRRPERVRSADVLHAHLTFAAFVATLLFWIRRLSGTRRPPVVETYHAIGMNVSPFATRVHAAMASQRDAVVLMAHEDPYWRTFAQRHPGVLVQTILNGAVEPPIDSLSSAERLEYRRQIGIPDDCRLVVGTIGRLHPDRQPWLYADVFAEIAARSGPGVHFVVSGGGPEYDRLTSLVAAKGLAAQVHFTGAVAGPLEPLSVMDLYVTVNVGGVTGVAAIEAALAGRPVVAIQVAAGYVAQPSDWVWSHVEVGEVGRRAAELLGDDRGRRALAARQQTYAREHHSVEVMARAYEALYESLVARTSSAQAHTRESN